MRGRLGFKEVPIGELVDIPIRESTSPFLLGKPTGQVASGIQTVDPERAFRAVVFFRVGRQIRPDLDPSVR
jgi:hypothetical protein